MFEYAKTFTHATSTYAIRYSLVSEYLLSYSYTMVLIIDQTRCIPMWIEDHKHARKHEKNHGWTKKQMNLHWCIMKYTENRRMTNFIHLNIYASLSTADADPCYRFFFKNGVCMGIYVPAWPLARICCGWFSFESQFAQFSRVHFVWYVYRQFSILPQSKLITMT